MWSGASGPWSGGLGLMVAIVFPLPEIELRCLTLDVASAKLCRIGDLLGLVQFTVYQVLKIFAKFFGVCVKSLVGKYVLLSTVTNRL